MCLCREIRSEKQSQSIASHLFEQCVSMSQFPSSLRPFNLVLEAGRNFNHQSLCCTVKSIETCHGEWANLDLLRVSSICSPLFGIVAIPHAAQVRIRGRITPHALQTTCPNLCNTVVSCSMLQSLGSGGNVRVQFCSSSQTELGRICIDPMRKQRQSESAVEG
jgi:hypothetical protein